MNNYENEWIIRYVARGNRVWDLAWSDPDTGYITAGSTARPLELDSEEAAIELAWSLNEQANDPVDIRLARFRQAAAEAVNAYECEVQDAIDSQNVRDTLLPAWVEGIDGLDTL